MKGLSAGRVQSVATRLVVERERERIEFRAAEYWDIVATFAPGRLRGAADRSRRPQGGAGPRLRPQRDAHDRRRRPRRRGESPKPRRRSRRRRVRGPLGRAQAVHAPPGRAVHDLDAPAGGEPQAAVQRPAHDAGRPAPLRERLHHLHAHRLDLAGRDGDRGRPRPGARAVRRRLGPRRAAHLQPQGEERTGGARGDPARRRQVPHTRRGAARGRARRGRPVRPGLEADGRLADGRRPRRDGLRPGRRDRVRRHGRRVRHGRHRDHVPRVHARLRGGPRRGRRRRRGGTPPAAARRGRRARARPRSSPSRTRRARRRATRRRRSSGPSRSAASAARPRTRRSSARSSTAATSARSARRSSRRSSPSR